MLTIYYEDNIIQVLKDFSVVFLSLNKFEKNKILKDIVNDISKGNKCTYTWQDFN